MKKKRKYITDNRLAHALDPKYLKYKKELDEVMNQKDVNKWTESETEFLKKNYPGKGCRYCADKLNRTVESVKSRITILKLKRIEWRKTWTKEDLDELTKLYPKTEGRVIAERFGVSLQAVYAQAAKLNLNKDPEFHFELNRKLGTQLANSDVSIKNRIKKGSVPPNKGKKMPEEFKKRIQHTFFTKGHQPKNTLFDGAVRQRHDKNGHDYKWIRISKGKWIMLQVYNWEKVNGPIPKDKIIVAIDGNTLNCDPDNWMMISRAEHLERNSGRKDLTNKYIKRILAPFDEDMQEQLAQSNELIELKRAELKLRRTINEHDRKS